MEDEDDPIINYVVRLRMRKSILDRIRQAARQNGSSVNSELIRRLSHDLPPIEPPNIGKRSRKNEIHGKQVQIVDQPAPAIGGMTARQADLLKFMQDYSSQHNGTTPTYEEMAKGIGLASKSGTSRLVRGLEERGFITRSPKQAQSIKLA